MSKIKEVKNTIKKVLEKEFKFDNFHNKPLYELVSITETEAPCKYASISYNINYKPLVNNLKDTVTLIVQFNFKPDITQIGLKDTSKPVTMILFTVKDMDIFEINLKNFKSKENLSKSIFKILNNEKIINKIYDKFNISFNYNPVSIHDFMSEIAISVKYKLNSRYGWKVLDIEIDDDYKTLKHHGYTWYWEEGNKESTTRNCSIVVDFLDSDVLELTRIRPLTKVKIGIYDEKDKKFIYNKTVPLIKLLGDEDRRIDDEITEELKMALLNINK